MLREQSKFAGVTLIMDYRRVSVSSFWQGHSSFCKKTEQDHMRDAEGKNEFDAVKLMISELNEAS